MEFIPWESKMYVSNSTNVGSGEVKAGAIVRFLQDTSSGRTSPEGRDDKLKMYTTNLISYS